MERRRKDRKMQFFGQLGDRLVAELRRLPDTAAAVANPTLRLAWYVVPLLVLLALGATVLLGAMVYCLSLIHI